MEGRRQRESGGACLLTLQPRTIREWGEIGATVVGHRSLPILLAQLLTNGSGQGPLPGSSLVSRG